MLSSLGPVTRKQGEESILWQGLFTLITRKGCIDVDNTDGENYLWYIGDPLTCLFGISLANCDNE